MGLGDREANASLMAALDACIWRFSRGAVVSGAAGFASRRRWSLKFDRRSPRYTTRLDDPSGTRPPQTPA